MVLIHAIKDSGKERNDMTKKTAIIDVGGGFRGIYGAGVTDLMLDEGISVDHAYGVSAGSADLFSFLCNQRGRTYKFYTDYAFRKEYASASNYVKTRNFVDLDYVYGTLSNHDGEYPCDYDAYEANPTDFTVVACNGNTGSAIYFGRESISRDNYDVMKASSALPIAGEPYVINGIPYFDGGLADPVPVSKAFDDGADRIILVLTHEYDFIRQAKKDAIPAALLSHSYPAAAHRLLMRYKTYNDEVALAKKYETEGKVLILAPDNLYGLNTLSRNLDGLKKMYQEGYEDAKAVLSFLDE